MENYALLKMKMIEVYNGLPVEENSEEENPAVEAGEESSEAYGDAFTCFL